MAILDSIKATYANAKAAVDKVTAPENAAPETKAVLNGIDKISDNMANAMQGAKDMFAKLGVKGALTTEEAPFIPTPPSARLAAEALAKARVSSIAQMTSANIDPHAAPEPVSTHWRDTVGRGPAVAETTASPQGALPPG
jgi:hypothetical protein